MTEPIPDALKPRVAVFGDVDVNLIDGSSIWLVSLCSVLARLELHGHVVLKTPIDRDILSSELISLSNFRVWEPADVGLPGSIRPSSIADAMGHIDESERLDIVIVRGARAAVELADSGKFDGRLWPYLTDVPQTAEDMSDEHRGELLTIFAASHRILCQTESLRSFLVSFFPEHDAKMILLPPMVPDSAFAVGRSDGDPGALRLFYAGKFAPQWGIEEMLSAVEDVRSEYPNVTITAAGDKIHEPPGDPGYRRRIESGLKAEGVDWLGGVGRDQVFESLADVDLALSVRTRSIDTSREISTKLLEYAAAGVPALINRTLAHQELLGEDYPLLIGGPEEMASKIREIAADPLQLESLRSGLSAVAEPYSMDAAADRLWPAIESSTAWGSSDMTDRRVVVAGHDLKFVASLIDGLRTAGADVRVDKWLGGADHDEARSRELVEWADTIVCEWCLANAAWYSHQKGPNQRLIVRFHRTELTSEWPTEVDIGAVDSMVFVADHVRTDAQERFDWDIDRLTVIPNFVDTVAFDREKLPGAPFTLGVLGYLPKLKRLDRALDVLEELRLHEPRYRLALKGALPWELSWVWNNNSERDYFERQIHRIRTSPLLRNAVSIERVGGDVPSWFRKIGFILSLSDIESFHLAMIEGMLAASVPIAADRPGASSIVDTKWLVKDDAEAAKRIQKMTQNGLAEIGSEARDEAIRRYSIDSSASAWLRVLSPESSDQRPPAPV